MLKRYLIAMCLWTTVTVAACPQSPPKDVYSEPLPKYAIARLGSTQFRHETDITKIRHTPDGKYLLTLTQNGRLHIWNRGTGNFSAAGLKLAGIRVQTFGLCDQGRLIAIAQYAKNSRVSSPTQAFKICIYDSTSGRKLRETKETFSNVRRVVFLNADTCILVRRRDTIMRDGRIIQITYPLYRLIALDTRTGKRIPNHWANHDTTSAIAVSPDGRYCARATLKREFEIWDVKQKRKIWTLKKHFFLTYRFLFSPDGRYLISNAHIAEDYLWDVKTGKYLGHSKKTYEQLVCALSPDGTRMALLNDGRIAICSMPDEKLLRRIDAGSTTISALAFSPNSKILATGGRVLTFWDVRTGKCVGPPVEFVLSSENGRYIVASDTKRKMFRIWKDGKLLAKRTWYVPRSPSGRRDFVFAISPNGKKYAAHDPKKRLCLFETESGRLLDRLPGTHANMSSVSFTRDGKCLILAGKTTRVWIIGEKCYYQAKSNGIGGKPNLTGDSRIRLSSSIELAEVLTEKTISFQKQNETAGRFSSSHGALLADNRTLAVAFNSDALAFGAEHSEIALVDILSGQVIGKLQGHAGRVTALAAPFNKMHIYAEYENDIAIVWDAKSLIDEWLAKRKGDPEKVSTHWQRLAASDVNKAYAAMRSMLDTSKYALALLAKKLQPVESLDVKKANKIIDQMNSKIFRTRVRATAKLKRYGRLVIPLLQARLKRGPTLEMKRRAESLIQQIRSQSIQTIRAIQLLEYIGNAQAKKLLQRMAKGAPESAVTRDAQAALGRLG